MARYAIVENGIVSGAILWDGVTAWDGSDAAILIPEGVSAGPRWGYVDGEFIPPVEAEELP